MKKASDDEIVGYIRRYRAERGYSPSIRDIAVAFGYDSPSTVKHRLGVLREQGRVTYVDRVPRTVKVVGDGD